MKIKLNGVYHYVHHVICECSDHSHTVRLTHFEPQDDWDSEIYISSHLSTEPNIFKRIWYGIRYVFGYRSRHGEFGETVMKVEQAKELRDYLTEFVESTNE
tara:strand:+ start:130 stop:432 length:303 start_codon:yes stop_codon:yes gene_type:complete